MNWIYLYYAFLALVILAGIITTIRLWLNQRRLDRQFEVWKASQTELYRRMVSLLIKDREE